jgi:hypothetical protein
VRFRFVIGSFLSKRALDFSPFRMDFGPLLGRILPTAAHTLRVPAMFLLITSPD